jgi:hypothetical protein
MLVPVHVAHQAHREDIENGKAASEAIACLESARDGRTLPQLQVALRPKGRKGTASV